MNTPWIAAATILIVGFVGSAAGQFQQGGVDHPGEWYVGEGLQAGDYFVYEMCHVDYKECAQFYISIWIEGDIQVESETKWLAHVVVEDGSKTVVGNMELGKIAPEPTGGSPELGPYRGAFKSSIVWLSAFANSNEPKMFSMPSWGKIANIGGEQILPKEVVAEGLETPAGYFDDVILIGWRTGGANSNVWVSDDFPFPLRALTWTHVSEGIPPKEYEFELQEYERGIAENPFAGIQSTAQEITNLGCPDTDELATSIKRPTNFFNYQVHVFYTPDPPVEDCPLRMLIKFISKFDDTEFLTQMKYDLWVVNVDSAGSPLTPPLRSLAEDDGRLYLYSPSGQSEIEFVVAESGMTNYLLYVYGRAPEHIVPPTGERDFLLIPLDVHPGLDGSADTPLIPDWIKRSALWWAQGDIGDESFVQGLQYLIREGIVAVPQTDLDMDATPGPIPDWIKRSALWWAQGDIGDESFVQGLQYLIRSGILRVS